MKDTAIMLYGYSMDNAVEIQNALEHTLGRGILLMSGSCREEMTVADIIRHGGESFFEEKETRILMFMGCDDNDIRMALSGFPDREGLARPIFCGLTEQNLKWTLSDLLEHLLEEKKYWTEKSAEEKE